ncbi:Leucine aminopeptidase 1 [Dinochytrium kinnereticum]|nr:Leucine aminopeptidase 1 [Dinochytrium kinnereticum]
MILAKLIAPALLLLQGVAAIRPNLTLEKRAELLTEAEAEHLNMEEFNALEVTKSAPAIAIDFPTEAAFQTVVRTMLANISKEKVTDWVLKLTSFPERYFMSPNGVAAAEWIRDQVNALKPSGATKLSVSLYEHRWKVQPSVVARYEPVVPSALEGIIITGSHFDTIAYGTGKPEPILNPAADDCASGSVIVFETLRVMVESGFIPERPIEFHWYAAEEVGLHGSLEIAQAYANNDTKVVSYLNLDQSGYIRAGTQPIMGLLTDYTTPKSTNFMKSIIDTYTAYNWTLTECGYAYEAALAFESHMSNAFPYNDRVMRNGTFLDTVDKMNFDHILEFVKSTIGFTAELSLTGRVLDQHGPFLVSVLTAALMARKAKDNHAVI